MCLFLKVLVTTALCFLALHTTSAEFSMETLLLHHLMSNLSKDDTFKYNRPVDNSKSIVNVSLRIQLKQILAFDAIEQILTIFAWKNMAWQNDYLKWAADDYAGQTSATLKADLLWLPDIILLNGVKTQLTTDGDLDVVVAYANGINTQSLPYIFEMPCPMDMRNFPFDIQKCKLEFGSCMYGKNEVDLIVEPQMKESFLDMENHIPNQEWLIVEAGSTIKDVQRGPTNRFRVVTCFLSLRRFADFYVQFVLIPTFLLAMLILTIFWIPPSRPDRTGLGMLVFGGLMLLLLLVVQISPPSTNVKIGTYYCVNIVLVVFSTVFSATVVALSNKNKTMNHIIRKYMVNMLGKLIFVTQQYEVMYPTDDDANAKVTAIRDWQVLAVVLDRLFFVIYSVVVIVCITLYFPFPDK